MTDYKRVIAVISDTHVGSRYALFPKKFKTEEGNTIHLNRGQEQILEYWHEFWRIADELKVDTVIHLADALHGLNRKEFGGGLLVSSLDEQKEAFIELMTPVIKGRKFAMLSGSQYHESLDTRVHLDLCHRLGGYYAGLMRNIKIEGTNRVFNIAHGTGGDTIYLSTALDREGLFIRLAESYKKLPHIDLVLRGHIHKFLHIHLETLHLVQVPCFMAYEPMKFTIKNYGRKQPDLGGVIILIDKQDRMTIHHFLMGKAPRISDNIQTI